MFSYPSEIERKDIKSLIGGRNNAVLRKTEAVLNSGRPAFICRWERSEKAPTTTYERKKMIWKYSLLREDPKPYTLR